jgi:hypothetical protein
MNYLALIKRIFPTWHKAHSKPEPLNTSVKYWQYETIPLKLYLEIASSGDLSKLVLSGNVNAEEAWEEIVRKNQQAVGSNRYDNYFEKSQSYALMVNEYIFVRSALIYLSVKPDKEVAGLLAEKGYKIDPKNYIESLNKAFRKSENLITKAISKQNELHVEQEQRGESSFEEIMANLVVGLGFHVNDDITLSRYNEYRKIIKKKHGGTRKKGRLE